MFNFEVNSYEKSTNFLEKETMKRLAKLFFFLVTIDAI